MAPFVFNQNNASKTAGSAVYPIQAIGDSGNVNRVGPLVTPEELRSSYLFGINLTSPITKQSMNNDTIKGFINRALNEAEITLGITIVETVRESRIPYDKALVDFYWYTSLPFRPVTYLNQWSVESSDGAQIFIVPPAWIETKNMHLGAISIGFTTVPVNSPVIIQGAENTGNVGSLILRNMGVYFNTGFFTVQYVTGFPLEKIPSPINQLVATMAAIDILSMISPLKINNSSSLGIDGLTQSVSGPGVQWLVTRMNDLRLKRDALIEQVKALYYLNFVMTNF